MLGRAVQGVKAQRLARRGVDDVVPGTCRYDDGDAVRQIVLFAAELDLAGSGFDTDELVVLVVRFEPDLLARLQRHQHELHVRAGEQYPAIVVVLERGLLDVGHVTGHSVASMWTLD